MSLIDLVFHHQHGPFFPGDVGGFQPDEAARLISLGVAAKPGEAPVVPEPHPNPQGNPTNASDQGVVVKAGMAGIGEDRSETPVDRAKSGKDASVNLSPGPTGKDAEPAADGGAKSYEGAKSDGGAEPARPALKPVDLGGGVQRGPVPSRPGFGTDGEQGLEAGKERAVVEPEPK